MATLELYLIRHGLAAERGDHYPDDSRRPLTNEGITRLKREAPAQEAVLVAFEAQAWVERIDDPLEPEGGLDVKERLRETAKSLNRGLKPGTIRFHADGSGSGFRWEVLG